MRTFLIKKISSMANSKQYSVNVINSPLPGARSCGTFNKSFHQQELHHKAPQVEESSSFHQPPSFQPDEEPSGCFQLSPSLPDKDVHSHFQLSSSQPGQASPALKDKQTPLYQAPQITWVEPVPPSRADGRVFPPKWTKEKTPVSPKWPVL